MVQTTSFAIFCLLVAPTLAVPITNDQHARAEDLEERDPNWFRPAVGGVLLREDAEEISQRDLESPESIEGLITRDEFQFTEREVEYMKDLTARDPFWFRKAFRAVRKYATPSNLMKAGKFAAGVLLREDAEEISQRNNEFQFTERDVQFMQDLTARDPNWFKKAFRVVRKYATPSNLMKAGKFAAGVLLREDAEEIYQRDDEFQFTEREVEYLKDLSARDPNWFRKAFRTVRKVATPSNLMNAGKFAANVLLREDAEELSQRDVEYEDLSTREPSIKSFFERVKNVFSPKKKAAEVEAREDDDDVFERYFDNFEIDELD